MINLCIETFNISDDLIVIGGDTLFFNDFELQTVIQKFYRLPHNHSLVMAYPVADTRKSGIIELNQSNKV